MSDRIEARVARLHEAIAATRARIETGRDGPEKLDALHGRIAEYERSLASFARWGRETPPTGNPTGVAINVPLPAKGA